MFYNTEYWPELAIYSYKSYSKSYSILWSTIAK